MKDPSRTKLFGTDGVRGVAYEPPLDEDTVGHIGHALASRLRVSSPRIVIGRDTRASGPDIETWLATGIRSGGGSVESVGVMTTPGVSFLTRHEGFDAGVVISASHNPFRDNGIKIFGPDGGKSTEALETRIEEAVGGKRPVLGKMEPLQPNGALERHYLDYLSSTLGENPETPELEIALDCAHGAGYELGPRLLEGLGMGVVCLGTEPTGDNINEACGSTHMDAVASVVVRERCDLGAALDGDGDRLLLVDSAGRLIDGDAILLLCARHLKSQGRLKGNAVVATVMSNMALEVALATEGIDLYRTNVGDKFVAQEMSERNIIIGGEQSGHIIFSDYASTGDGLLTLLQVLRVLNESGKSLDELGRLTPYPQVLVNVRVRKRPDVSEVPKIADAISSAERELEGRGRVLVRYSGTEPLLRIMMEGPEEGEIRALVSHVADAVEETIGEECSPSEASGGQP